jgi:hypothetical protein
MDLTGRHPSTVGIARFFAAMPPPSCRRPVGTKSGRGDRPL